MNMPLWLTALLALILAGIAAANLAATRRIVRCAISSRTQKTAQLLFVWLLPPLGAIVTLMLTQNRVEPHSGRYSTPPEKLEDVAVSRHDYGDGD